VATATATPSSNGAAALEALKATPVAQATTRKLAARKKTPAAS